MAELNPDYQLMLPLQQVIFNPVDGTPLAGGIVKFFSDTNRTVPKDVYALSSGPPYTYIDQGPILTLGAIGQFLDNTGNSFDPYLWILNGTPSMPVTPVEQELYYIEVYTAASGGTGTPLFTVQAWPGPNNGGGSSSSSFPSIDNQITNSQFVESFLTNGNNYISVTGGNTVTQIAPNWELVTSGTGTILLYQSPVTFTGIDGNPPYSLQFSAWSGSITQCILQQTLTASPNLLAGNFVYGSFAAASTDSVGHPFTMNFVSPTSVITTLASGSTPASNGWVTFGGNPGAVQLPAATATAAPASSYIQIILPQNTDFTISNIQLVGVANASTTSDYLQESTPLQQAKLFSYYEPYLNFKPVSSYLVGWDFPLNPAQFGSTVNAFATGVNGSYYVWDQTILFQTADSSIDAIANSNSALRLTSTKDTQIALVQYIPPYNMGSLIAALNNSFVSSNLFIGTQNAQQVTVTLWWTTSATLPTITTPSFDSLVVSIDSNANPSVVSGWTKVKRTGFPGAYASTVAGGALTDYGFNGWNDNTNFSSATFFAIVVAFDTLANGKYIDFQSISLVPGNIPTRPAPQAVDEVFRECMYYYEMSYPTGVSNPYGSTNLASALLFPQITGYDGSNLACTATAFSLIYRVIKINAGSLKIWAGNTGTLSSVSAYVVYGTGGSVLGYTDKVISGSGNFWTASATVLSINFTPTISHNNLLLSTATTSGNAAISSGLIAFNYVLDARLGTF